MKGNYGQRFLSLMLSVIMVMGMLPTSAFATDDGVVVVKQGLCEHHTEHTAECGYSEGTAGTVCDHKCEAGVCTTEAVECDCTETDENGTLLHAENCGYVAGEACTHDCTNGDCAFEAAEEPKECSNTCEICGAAMLNRQSGEEKQTLMKSTAPAADGVIDTAEALKEAFAAGGEVVLGAGITVDDETLTASNVSVELDLNGHTLTANKGIKVSGGDLTVNDSGADGKLIAVSTESGWIDGVYAENITFNNVTVKISGDYDGLYAMQNIAVNGGTVNVAVASSYSVVGARNGTITVDSGELICTNDDWSSCVSAQQGIIISGSGKLTAATKANLDVVLSNTPADGSSYKEQFSGEKDGYSTKILIAANAVAPEEDPDVDAETYALSIGGVAVTEDNCTTNEQWSYDAKTKTLTLNGFRYEGEAAGIWWESDDMLTLVLNGENSIVSTGNDGVHTGAHLVISADSTGSLYVKGNNGIKLEALNVNSNPNDGLYIYGGTLTAEGTDYYGYPVYSSEYIELGSGMAVLESKGDVFYSTYFTKNGQKVNKVTIGPAPEVNYVAMIGEQGYETLSAAFAAVTDDAQTVTILKDVEEELTGAYLRGNIVADEDVTITLTNTDWVYCPYTFVLGENITMNVPMLFYYAGGTQINGTLVVNAYYQRYAGTKLTVNEPGSMTVTGETCIIRYMDGDPNAGIYIVGDNDDSTVGLNLSVAYFYQGMINAKDANIKCGVYWQTNETDNEGSANLVLDNSTLDVTVNEHNFMATGNSTVTLTNGSVVECDGGHVFGENAEVTADTTSSFEDKSGPVELPAPAEPVAEVNGVGCKTTDEIVAAVKAESEAGNDVTVKFLEDIEIDVVEFDYGTGDITFTADKPVTVKVGTDFVLAEGQNITIKVDENVTLDIAKNESGVYVYYGPGMQIEGEITGGQNWGCLYLFYGTHTVAESGVVSTGRVQLGSTTLTVKGKIDSNYLLVEDTDLVLNGATVETGYFTDTNKGDQRWGASNISVINGTTVNATTVELKYADSVLTIDKDSSITADAVQGAGKIVVDATGMQAGDTVNITATDLSGFTGKIETNADEMEAVIEDGKIVLKEKFFAASIGEKKYETLTAAINAAVNGDVITLIADHAVETNNTTYTDSGYVYLAVEGKEITIDLNGYTLSAENNNAGAIDGVFGVMKGGKLTINDSSDEKDGTVKMGAGYALLLNYGALGTGLETTLTINGGNYDLATASNSLVFAYKDGPVVVNGGNFDLGNVGTGENGSPWIFNVAGQNVHAITINGGTYNDDVANQYWKFEAQLGEGKAIEDNGNDTWSVIDAVVNGTHKEWVYPDYNWREITKGYATLADAVAAVEEAAKGYAGTDIAGETVTITLLKDCGSEVSISEYITLDLNGNKLTGTIVLSEGATLTAVEGLNVTTDVEGYEVEYKDGKYIVVEKIDPVAKIGSVEFATLADAVAAAQAGDTVTILKAGTYTVPPTGKDLTITGAEGVEVKFDMSTGVGMGGANVTFDNVTFEYGNANYVGLQHAGNLVYNNCTFNGQVFLYGASETFDNCTFNQTSSDAYNVWTYGAKEVEFNGCTFNSAGKSVLIYSEDANLINNVTVKASTFNASAAVEGKAAIEMDSSLTAGINLTIDGATTATGFGTGNVSGNSLWNNKKGNADEANNDITVVVNGETVLQPEYAAKIGDTKYITLSAAITAAKANDTITFVDDITEDVTINKNVTIDGAGKTYTGKMTLKADTTIKNVNFDGKGYNGYAVETRGAQYLTIEDCTAKNYGYGFVQLASGTALTTVKNVTVSGCAYGVKIDYSNAVVLENVDLDCTVAGVLNSNHGEKLITIKDSDISILGTWGRDNTTKTNYVFEGENSIDEFVINADLDSFKLAAGATLTAPNTITVTTDVEEHEVEYENGVYGIKEMEVAEVNGTTYPTLAKAIDAAKDGKTVKVLTDIELTEGVTVPADAEVTLDLNGKTISGVDTADLYAMIHVMNGAELTVMDSSTDKTGKITYDAGTDNKTGAAVWVEGKLTQESGIIEITGEWSFGFAVDLRPNAWSTAHTEAAEFVMNGGKIVASDSGVRVTSNSSDTHPDPGVSFTMKGGEINSAYDAVFIQNYTYASDLTVSIEDGKITSTISHAIRIYGNDDAKVNVDLTVTGGMFSGKLTNLSATGEGKTAISGGLFASAPDRAYLAENHELTIVYNDNGDMLFGVKKSDKAYVAMVGTEKYEKLQEAFDAAKDGETVYLLNDIEQRESVKVTGTVILDLNGKTITGTDNNTSGNFYLINNNKGNLTIKDTSAEKTGAIKLTAVNERNWTASSVVVANNLGTLTIEGGLIQHLGGTSMAYGIDNLTNGAGTVATLNVKGGTVDSTYFAIRQFANGGTNNLSITDGNVGYAWMQSPNANANVANISVTGGLVDGICLSGGNAVVDLSAKAECVGEVYGTAPAGKCVDNVDGVYTLVDAVAQVNDQYFLSLTDALNACTNGETVKVLQDITYGADDVVYAHGGATGFGDYDQYNPSIVYVGGTKGETPAQNQPSKVNAVLDLNGHTITNTADAYLFMIMDNAQVVFTDSGVGGTVKTTADAPALWVMGTETLVTIKGGTYQTASATGVIHVTHGGDMVIEGGKFSTTADDASLLLMINSHDRQNSKYFISGVATLKIKGGEFKGFNPAYVGDDNGATSLEDIKFVDGCADGYLPVENSDGTYGVKQGLSGSGTAEDPYKIESLKHLIYFRDSVNAGETKYNASGVYVALTADIDMQGATWKHGIGDGINASFDGIFDGKNHTIENLNFASTVDAGYICGGLFGYIYGDAQIKNLVLDNVNVTTEDEGNNVGVLVGFAYKATGAIENVTVKNSTINAASADGTGAIVGYVWYGALTVKNCTVEDSTVTGRAYVGGIVGYADGKMTLTDNTVKNVTVNAKAAVGGVAGILLAGGTVDGATVTDVTLTAAHENWQNAKGAAVGCITGAVTVSGTFDADYAVVGAVHADKPTTPVEKVAARIGDVYYTTFEAAYEAAKAGDTVKVFEGTYSVPSMKAGITIEGVGDVLLEGTLSGTLENLTLKNLHIKGGNAQRWAYAKGNCTFENVTFEATGVYALHFDGITAGANLMYKDCTIIGWAAMSGSPASCVFDSCTFKGNGTYGVIRTYFDATIQNCTFDVANVNTDDVYQDGIHAVEATVTVTDSTNVNGDMAEIVHTSTDVKAGYVYVDGTKYHAHNFNTFVETVASTANEQGYTVYKCPCGETENRDFTEQLHAVAQIGEVKYESLADALTAAKANDTIVLLADITEDVTVSKSVTIDGADKTYTGKMTLKADTTIKNVNFDGKGYNGYAVETRGANYLTIEDCTAKSYGYGFVQLASGTALTTVKNVTVSDMNYGVKVDYSNAVVLENVDITAAVAGVLNSNYGEKTITVKNSDINILGTWTRNNTIKTTYVFEGENSIDEFIIDAAIDNFKLADANSTLTAPNEITVTTDVEGSEVEYKDGKYIVVSAVRVAQIGETQYKSLSDAITAAKAGDTIVLLADITEDVTVSKSVTIDGAGKTYTGQMKLTNKADITIKNVNFDGKGYNGYAVEARGAYYITIEDCTAKNYGYGFVQLASGTALTTVKDVTVSDMNYGVKVDYSNAVVLENVDITAAVAGVLNSNYGEKTITVKNSDINILGTWTRNNTIKTTYVFEGENTIDEFVIDAAIDNFKLAADATLTAPNDITVTTDVEGSEVEYKDGKYVVVPAVRVAQIGDVQYKTLADAITVAKAGDTITLLADITEDVTVNKSVTIDGANFNYTGNISVNGSTVDVIVKNVNFVNGTGYAITTNTIKSITVEDCTVSNYGYGFLYANKSTPTVVVKNVTVDSANYGMHWVYGSNATLENVTMTNVVYGLYIQNYAGKTINVKNSTISSIAIWERDNQSGVQTFNFEGANTVGTLTDSQYAKYVLNASDATLTAPAGATVTTSVEGGEVIYRDGKYQVIKPVAQIGDELYGSLQAAIDAVAEGETATVKLIANVDITNAEFGLLDGSYDTFVKVEGKNITIDLNGKTISGDYAKTDADVMLVGLFSTDNNGHLTLTGNGIVNITATGKVYSLIANYEPGCSITIENGTFTLDKAIDSLIYTGANDNAEGIVINDGNFTLGNVGKDNSVNNGKPWIFNVLGQNQTGITVNGGTFNADVAHQAWANEVFVPETKALKNNGDDTWTVADAVAYTIERGTLNNSTDHKVGYATLAEAVNADAAEVYLLKDIDLSETVKVKGTVVLDLNGKTITGTDNAAGSFALIEIQPGAELTVKGEGKITLTATNDRGWNAYSSVISNQRGKLTVENGTIEHLGGTDMAYAIDNLTNGKGTYAETVINGGHIKSTYRAIRQFLNGVEAENILTVNGGTIEGANKSIWMQDPSVNANSGKLTVDRKADINGDVYLFVTAGSAEWPVEVAIASAALQGESTVTTGNVPAGYEVKLVDGIYGVYTVNYAAQNTTTGVQYATVSEALTAANAEDTVVLVETDGVITDDVLMIKSGVTLDLNGQTLTASYVMAFGGHVVDNSTAKTGLLKTENISLAQDNSQLPVWNETEGGYSFLTIGEKFFGTNGISRGRTDEDKLYYVFQPELKDILADGAENNKIQVVAELTWVSNNKPQTLTLEYLDGELMQYGTSTSTDGRLSVTVTGLTGLENVAIRAKVISDTGVCVEATTKYHADFIN